MIILTFTLDIAQDIYQAGLTTLQQLPAIGDHKFEPQTSDNYEVGFRGFFLDDRLMRN